MNASNELTETELVELQELEAQEQEDHDADKIEEVHQADELVEDEGETLDDTEVPETEPIPLGSEKDSSEEDEEDEEQRRRRLAREETENARSRYLANRPNDFLNSL